MKDEYVTSLLLLFAIVFEQEKKDTIRAILYRRINVDLSTTLSIELLTEFYKRKKERNKLNLL